MRRHLATRPADHRCPTNLSLFLFGFGRNTRGLQIKIALCFQSYPEHDSKLLLQQRIWPFRS